MDRYAGVLLHVTSLPSKYGIGCFDQAAYDFVDWLVEAGQKYWQILPLGSTARGSDDSPYQAYSAFAGNPYLISLDALIEEGVLTKKECDQADFGSDPATVDFIKLSQNRCKLLHKAYERSDISKNQEYQAFCRENGWWLDDYALFMALKEFFGGVAFQEWPEDIRMHWGFALDYYNRELYFDVEFQKYMQFKFLEQWSKLKKYANDRNIQIIGDIPIYVSPDGADVWAHPELFQLDEENRPTAVAGCPPDAFTEDGQLWGNPLYRWDLHKATGFEWWVSRMAASLKLYDVVRIDHFRGFDEYYSIPKGAKTAKIGKWLPGPGMDLFRTIQWRLGEVNVIAEDLGYMNDSVRKLVKDSGYPNMKILQFMVETIDESGSNDYWPHNYAPNCVVYTGTHDNGTLVGAYKSWSKETKNLLRRYMGDFRTPEKDMPKQILRMGMNSVAKYCILPIQDLLGLDNSARMNTPGTVGINWRWRMTEGMIPEALAGEMLAMAKLSGRANWDNLKKDGKEEEKAEEAEAETEA